MLDGRRKDDSQGMGTEDGEGSREVINAETAEGNSKESSRGPVGKTKCRCVGCIGKTSALYVLRYEGKLKVGYTIDLRRRLAIHRSYLKGHELIGIIPGPEYLDLGVRRLLKGLVPGKLDWFADTAENLQILKMVGVTNPHQAARRHKC